jgi:hypothetical protein
VFYGITAAAALWQARASLASGAANLFFGGVMPLIGVAFSAWVLIQSVATGAVTIPVMLYGLGSIAVGAAIAVYLDRFRGIDFFNAVPVGTSSTS